MSGRSSITVRFEGDSGDGIISMGKVAARTAARLGYHVYTYSTFLAVVRGGQVTFQLRIGTEPLLSQGNEPDILVGLNKQALVDNGPKVVREGLILYPPLDGLEDGVIPPDVKTSVIDFDNLSEDVTGATRSKNIVAVGALLGVLGIDEKESATVVRETFKGKGAEVADTNVRALEAGSVEGRQAADLVPHLRLGPVTDPRPRILMSGNEAVAFGALAGGVRFFAGYPITPASEIMEWLATYLPKVGGHMIQAEDEIASLGMCIGASFGGVKSMTATSGPGLSLMIELLGLAGMAEIPVVVVDVQRAGPSTGMPTKEAQGDLNQAVHGMHGEAPKIVLAPQTVADCFEQTVHAVNLAHRFHVPVLVLSSQSLSHRTQTIDMPDFANLEVYQEALLDPATRDAQPFLRFRMMPDGQPSVRSIPGIRGGQYQAGGLEHDEAGKPNFDPPSRQRMVERRRERMHAIERSFSDDVAREVKVEAGTPLGLTSWGTTASACQEVLEVMAREGYRFSRLFPHILWPMPDVAMRRFLSCGIRLLFVPELNATRQFAEMIRARYTKELLENNIEVVSILKDDGLPFSPGEIRDRIVKVLEDRHIESEAVR